MNAVDPGVLGRWSAGSGPLYKRLADAFRTAIARGDITSGVRLPPERHLAHTLNVSRSTVVSAYDQLYAEGLVTRRQGSGTWVAPAQASSVRRSHLHEVWVPQAALRTIVDNPGNVVPFTASTVERLPHQLPKEEFELSADEVLHLPPYFEIPAGLPELRERIAQLYEFRGLRTSPEQIVVTAGAQEAISLVASAHLSHGDLALIESPTYPGAIDALSFTGARLCGIRVDSGGADVESIERCVTQGHVGLVYLIPTFHNPTGALMQEWRRKALASVLLSWNVPLIDDESLVYLSFGQEPPAPIPYFAGGATVYSVGSMSKLFWGGLRIGWVRCPEEAVGPIMRLKSINDLSCSLVSQVLAVKLLDRREEMMRIRRAELTERLTLYRTLMSQRLPTWSFDDPAGGVSLWVDIGVDADEFAQVALREGVALVPGATISVDRGARTHIRLPLALDHDLIESGICRLERAWKRFAPDERPLAEARLNV